MKTTQSKAPQVTAQSTTKKAHKDIDFKTHNTQHTQNQIDTTQQPDFNAKNPNPITKKTNDNSETTLKNDTQTVHFHDKQSSTSTVGTNTNQSPSEITTSDISNNTTPTIKTTTTSNNNNPTTITGTFSAGKYIEGDTNSIKVYKADGSSTLIGTGSFNDNGQITITLTGTNANYTGAVYIKLTKTGISHQDELNGTEAL
ncbi:hypothetical protein, partial [Bathymodiolus thermophilus thioautotrophic gill symbiont]|uniref:hypothetical protein n=1 Tax=Bathymodiolus thermophilus thioautotrophic gill symbiont TaxID=2360 RepID=UPI001116F4F3